MSISGKITDAQFREVVVDSWRLGLMKRDIRAADMVREIKRRLLAELQANTECKAAELQTDMELQAEAEPRANTALHPEAGLKMGVKLKASAEARADAEIPAAEERGRADAPGMRAARNPADGQGAPAAGPAPARDASGTAETPQPAAGHAAEERNAGRQAAGRRSGWT